VKYQKFKQNLVLYFLMFPFLLVFLRATKMLKSIPSINKFRLLTYLKANCVMLTILTPNLLFLISQHV